MNSFDARSTLSVGGRAYEIFRLDALQAKYDVARLPFSLKVLLENLLRNEDGHDRRRPTTSRRSRSWVATDEPSREIAYTPGARAAAGLHRRARDRRPRRDARRDGRPRRRPGADQPAAAGRARDRPLGAGGRSSARRVAFQFNAEREFERNRSATRSCAGASRRSTTSRSCRPTPASATRSTSSTWRAWCSGAKRRDAAGLPRHARRHRLAHHDGQRPRRARLGRGRDRGRGGDARPARLDADPAGDRLQAERRAAGGRDRDRPGADRHADAAREGRGRESSSSSSAPGSRGCRLPTAPRSRTCRRSRARPA